MKQNYIYKSINLINGNYYIGKHFGEVDDNYLGSGTRLLLAIKKYGRKNFKKEILEICSEDNVYEKEKIYIGKCYKLEECYNLRQGGFGGINPTTETRKKMSQAKKGKNLGKDNNFFGKHHTKERKKIIGLQAKERNTGRKFTNEHKKNLSDSIKKNHTRPTKGRSWYVNSKNKNMLCHEDDLRLTNKWQKGRTWKNQNSKN